MARPKSHPDTLSRDSKVSSQVRKMAYAGVPRTKIFSSVRDMTGAPQSYAAFLKYYSIDLDQVSSDLTVKVANKLIKTALEGEEDNPNTQRSREFYLDRQGGWNKKETVETRELDSEEEENESAVEALMTALGKNLD